MPNSLVTLVKEPSLIVVIEPGDIRQVVDEQIGIAVVVVVDPGAALGERLAVRGQAGHCRDFLELAVAQVAIEAVGLPLAGDEQIEPAVVVVIGPAGGVGIDGSSSPASSVTSVK